MPVLVILGFILRLRQDRRHGGQLFKHLRQRGKRRSSSSGKDLRGFIPNRVSIFGDWEGDTVVTRISKAVLLVLVERRSRLIKLERLSNRPATTVAKATCSLLKGHMVRVRSITADHGREFAAHVALSRRELTCGTILITGSDKLKTISIHGR